jgi:15-cis-phytoene synthase
LRDFDPDVTIALAYARADLRKDFEALIALDAQLGQIVRTAKEPMLARIRLAWWREQLEGLNEAPLPADPILQAVRVLLQRHDVNGGALAPMVNGWETLLEGPPFAEAALAEYAGGRGGTVFEMANRIAQSGGGTEIRSCGEAWARNDLVRSSGFGVARKCAVLIPKALRPFAILARFAERDAADGPERRARPGSPRRMMQAAGYALFGW